MNIVVFKLCGWYRMMPVQTVSFNQYEGVILKLFFIFYDHTLSLEKQEESEETENQIYIRHLEAILQSIPLEKDLDHLLASWVNFDCFSSAVLQ